MNRFARAGFSLGIIGTLLAAPLMASATPYERSYQLSTRIVEQTPGFGEFDGTMQLRVSSDGIVTGYYRPNNERFIQVNGGLVNGHFWLDIGSSVARDAHFTGTFNDGVIDALAFSRSFEGRRNISLKLTTTVKGT